MGNNLITIVLKCSGVDVFHISRVTISLVLRPILVSSLGTIAYTKDIDAIILLQGGFTYPDMLCLIKTHYLMCLQRNIKLTLMSHLTMLFLLNLSLNRRHPIIMIQENYKLLARPLLLIMLLHLMYSLMIRVILNSQAQYQMLKNRLNLMIHTLTLKLQLQILNMPAALRNKLLLKVQPMIIIKQPL